MLAQAWWPHGRTGDHLTRSTWVLATTAGEVVGFGLVGILAWAVLVLPGGEPRLARLLLFSAAGALVEGGILASAQHLVLRRRLPSVGAGAWATATIVPAFLAYAAGMTLLPRLGEAAEWASLAALGVAMVLAMGVGQWLLLRRHASGARAWIPASALAWTLGLAASIGTLMLVPEGAPPWASVAAAVPAGVLMGLVVGLVTSVAFVRLRPRAEAA